jgi:hypothetical protein
MILLAVLDVLGLALTLLGLALLAAGGYLLALRLLGEEALRDRLALAIATLLAATAEALAIGLLLGAVGLLRFEVALSAQAFLVVLLALAARRAGPALDPGLAVRQLVRRTWARLREHPALSLIAVHAAGSEALRGLLRPPLSFDSLMYHLLLTATWLQEHNLRPLNGNYPISDYGYVPANGSVWFWWWMAPSHSELYVNLGALPLWALLGLAVGGIGRRLGARRNWPLASFLVLLIPVVVRFVATQYVDILLAAAFVAGFYFTLRWLDRPRWADAVLAGAGYGLTCGTKILGPPYVAALAAAALLLVPRSARQWRTRLPQMALAALLTLGLGGFFYLRNIALGAGPLALECEGRTQEGKIRSAQAIASLGVNPPAVPARPAPPGGPGAAPVPVPGVAPATAAAPAASAPPSAPAASASPMTSPPGTPIATATPAAAAPGSPASFLPAVPRKESVLDLWSTVGRQQLLDVFLGITRPQSLEMGFGPESFVLLLAFLALPWGVAAAERRAALFASSQIAFQLIFWLVVPFAANLAVFANLRYLVPAAGLALAGGVAIAEQRGMSDLWQSGIAIALACQGVLQLHAEMPRGVRLAIALADLGAVVLGLSSGLRRLVRRRAGACAAAALALALVGAPVLGSFRRADRSRALANEWTVHSTSVKPFTGAWRWLDRNGEDGTVAYITSPGTYFIYPAMGPYLERKARYFNVNAANYDLAHRYRFCNPRVDPSPAAWLSHLTAGDVRWLLVSRYPVFDWPPEREWALALPSRFTLRYSDEANFIFELHPAPLVPWRKPAR